jgi:hypothetical protein
MYYTNTGTKCEVGESALGGGIISAMQWHPKSSLIFKLFRRMSKLLAFLSEIMSLSLRLENVYGPSVDSVPSRAEFRRKGLRFLTTTHHGDVRLTRTARAGVILGKLISRSSKQGRIGGIRRSTILSRERSNKATKNYGPTTAVCTRT